MFKESKKTRENNRAAALAAIVPVAIVGKIVALFILPEKYFYDNGRMVSMLTGGNLDSWGGYQSTVDIFAKIDFFHFTTMTEWSLALGAVGTVILLIMVSKVKEMSISEVCYTLMAAGLLNIYVFNIGKEPVQMTYFLCALIVIMLPFDNNTLKIIGCALVFYWESNTFRSYYILMAVMCIGFWIVFSIFRRIVKNMTSFKIVLAIAMCAIAMLGLIFMSQFVDKKSYDEVMDAKFSHTNVGATTDITNWVGDENDAGNYGNFMINYVINGIRMMFPVELLIKSPGYFPFVIYQVFLLVYWIRAIKNIKTINNHGLLALICFTSYIFGSFTFEPDFGSWVRHEAASFPVFYVLAFEDLCKKEEEELEEPTEVVYETKNIQYID